MLIPNHPHDERLSMLASGDPEATTDSQLTEHVDTCARCTDAVAELSTLRLTLAELPDLRPHRPLRLLPEVDAEPSGADRLAGWARRFFAPVLAAGAAVAMVGLVGTASPATLEGMLPGGNAGAATEDSAMEVAAESDDVRTLDGAESSAGTEAFGAGGAPAAAASSEAVRDRAAEGEGGDSDLASQLPAERSPWPMVLFTGVALMVAAALLRWILAPRAG
jgi:hypothetical protein